jgi:hypothetical protein
MDLSDLEELGEVDVLITLYALIKACQEQGAPRVANAVKAGVEEIMWLRGELDTLKDDFIEGVELTDELVAGLRTYIANVDDDPVLGPAIKKWARVVRVGE